MTGNVSALFRATFGEAPRVVASAPGRVNLIGEHTDYNGGPVLPLATPARTSVAVGPAPDGVLELISTLDGEPARIDLRDGRPAGGGAAGARAAARVRLARGAAHPDPGTVAARRHGHAARAASGRPERAPRRVRGGGGPAAARAAGAGVARQLAGALAAAPQARPDRAAALARAACRGRDCPHPVRRPTVDPGTPAAVRRAPVRGPRVVPAPVRVQRAGARPRGRRGAPGGRAGRPAHGCGLGRRGAGAAGEEGRGKSDG